MMKVFTTEMEKIIETKVKPNLKDIYNLRIKGLTDRHIAQYIGISLKQFLQVLDETELLQDVYNDATTLLCSELRNVVIERALGTDGKTDRDGDKVGPDANLALRVLEKLDPQFKQKTEININTITVEQVIKRLNEQRRLELETIEVIEQKHSEVS